MMKVKGRKAGRRADKASDEKSEQETEKPEPITIDVEGITQRVVAFPYPHVDVMDRSPVLRVKRFLRRFREQDTPSTDDSRSSRPRGVLHVLRLQGAEKGVRLSLELMIFNSRVMRKHSSM